MDANTQHLSLLKEQLKRVRPGSRAHAKITQAIKDMEAYVSGESTSTKGSSRPRTHYSQRASDRGGFSGFNFDFSDFEQKLRDATAHAYGYGSHEEHMKARAQHIKISKASDVGAISSILTGQLFAARENKRSQRNLKGEAKKIYRKEGFPVSMHASALMGNYAGYNLGGLAGILLTKKSAHYTQHDAAQIGSMVGAHLGGFGMVKLQGAVSRRFARNKAAENDKERKLMANRITKQVVKAQAKETSKPYYNRKVKGKNIRVRNPNAGKVKKTQPTRGRPNRARSRA